MLPSVAYQSSPHFLPHQRLDHPPSATPSLNQYDLASAALHAAFRRPHENMPGRSFQPMSSSSRTRHQYPQPIQRPNAQSIASSGLSVDINQHPEHCLRRKTPNGTIAAGFDATPGAGEGSIQQPALKHIIVSSLDNNGQVLSSSQHGLLPNSAQYNSGSTPVDATQYHHQANFPAALNYDTMGNRTTYSGSMPQGAHGGNWIRSLNYPADAMGPLLNQFSGQPQPQQLQRHYWQNGPTTPTVIASSFQPGRDQNLGNCGQYGSYWPDGGHTPFYPAALRDSRYQSAPSFLPPHVQDDPLSSYQTPFNRQSIPSSDHVTPGFSWNPLPAQSGHPPSQAFNSNNNTHHHNHAANSFSRRHNVQPQNASEPAPLWAGQHPLPAHPSHHAQPAVEGAAFSAQAVRSSADAFQAPPAVDLTSQPRNTEFKEKILSWAHSIYVDLLASLPSARKSRSSQSTHDPQSRNPPNPGIYPKPPRQPASDFSSHSVSGARPVQSSRHHGLPFHPHPRTHSRSVDHHASGFLDQRLASQLHVSPNPYNSNNFVSSRFDSHGHFVSSFDRRSSHDPSYERFRNLRRPATGQTSRLFSPVHYGASPTENAAAALEILSSLCIESGWEWIDGVLVGGCLAYGLGDYEKAARWYSRIIQRDPT